MGSKTDKIKGRLKEAAGVLAKNDNLKREGQRDQVVGKVKETAERSADGASRAPNRTRMAGGRIPRDTDREESQIFRIDHYLGKETVQNILEFRLANPLFEPIWNRRYVDCVTITAVEAVGVEHRGGYYDHAGALRDMVQNHLMQLPSSYIAWQEQKTCGALREQSL